MNKYSNINRFFKNNSSTILTILGSVGVGVTAIVSARDTVKAVKRIDKKEREQTCTLGTKDKIKTVAPCYIPTVITGLSTVLCVCGAHKLNKNIQDSLTSAYVLLDRSYREYRNSVKELYGVEGNTNVIKNVANKYTPEEQLDLTEQEDTDIFFDFFSLRFFKSNLAKIHEAEKAANEMLKMHGYISLGTLYSFLDEDVNGNDELLGWSLDAGRLYGYDRIEIVINETITENGSKQYVLDFKDSPTEDYLHV